MSAIAPSRLEVDLDAYAHNLAFVRAKVPESCGIIAVLKANAYGHGALPLAKRALTEGVAMIGVATVQEGIELREGGVHAPVLVLVHPQEDALAPAVEHDLKLMVSNVAIAERLGEIAHKRKKVAAVHCEIDTGMGRLGFNAENAPQKVLLLTRVSNVDVEGVATHFSSANLTNDNYTANQVRAFRKVLRQLERNGIPFDTVHAANSAGILSGEDAFFDLVRPGIITYGVWPNNGPPKSSPLRPVARWISSVALVKEIPGGSSVGYERTYSPPAPMQAAIVPVGYADGYPLRLSNRGEVLVRGKRCPVRGAVSMDQIVVDVTSVRGVAPGDEVTLLGPSAGETISVEELAEKAETSPYEVLTGIGQRVQRVYLNEKQP